jgi:hypothetical protein
MAMHMKYVFKVKFWRQESEKLSYNRSELTRHSNPGSFVYVFFDELFWYLSLHYDAAAGNVRWSSK